jgi:hypothetical protein
VKCESPTLRGRRGFVHDRSGERKGRGAGRVVGTIHSDRRVTRGDLATVSDNNTDVTVSNQQFNLPNTAPTTATVQRNVGIYLLFYFIFLFFQKKNVLLSWH